MDLEAGLAAGGTNGAATAVDIAAAVVAVAAAVAAAVPVATSRSQKSNCRCFHGDCSIALNYKQNSYLERLIMNAYVSKYRALESKDDAKLLIGKC